MLNLEYLYNFLETAQQGSLNKASEKLNITHPALSKQIGKIEEYYGVPMFTRSSKGVALTDAGTLFYERILAVINQLDTLKSDLHQLGKVRKITLGTLPSLATYYLPPIVYEIEQQGTQIDLVIRNHSAELLELLDKGSIQAAIIDETSSSAHLSWREHLFTEALYAVIPPAHPFNGVTDLNLHMLQKEPLILHPPHCDIRKRITRLMELEQLELHIKSEVEYGDFILGYVAAGAGITIVPEILSHQARNLGLQAVRIGDPYAQRALSLTFSSVHTGQYLLNFFRK